jgi:hypothetical protein
VTKTPVKNIAASVRARLLNIAKKSGRDFDAVMLQYMQERFLYGHVFTVSYSPEGAISLHETTHDLLYYSAAS